MKKKRRITIDPEIGISELVEQYPELNDILQSEFGFHCVNCIFSEMDTLEEGAALHGIEGQNFVDMVEYLEAVLNS